ncbi:MAG: Asp-tRNA(Asn)/Glu-tRNA(Gln) amidotransferase subunit GatB [Deltaproteobacteria bacterium]|nr:Asp-tRNA(Asn)/Glu-tRNA(Gln) amidotransferase subunit GatB [Deltaproteobacteria bacterium]
MEFEAVIGLEVHAQLLTRSKIFCGCPTAFGAPPNTQVCPVCLGMPGTLPVLNRQAVAFALKMALATGCRINPESVFARKNYFYPDLPKGYQISQYELPLAEHGQVDITVDGRTRRIGITRIHLEEDAGKLIHGEARPVSFVDFNRTGVPLIEIVSEPDLRTPEEAAEYLKVLRNILLYLEICDGNMEEGSLRCDANISLRPVGTSALGARTELKNMNSFRFVRQALDYEIRRQRTWLEDGREIVQETRLWDAAKGQTFSMRGKEEAHDYRYFPDPDLLPVRVSDLNKVHILEVQDMVHDHVVDELSITQKHNLEIQDARHDQAIASLWQEMPELPKARRERFHKEYNLPEYDADVLTSDKALADYFEATLEEFPQPKVVSNWIMGEVMRELKREEAGVAALKVAPRDLGRLLALVEQGAISGKIAKTVFEEMAATGGDPESIIREKNLAQISDTGALETQAQEILAAHPKEAADYRAGKTKVMGFFVGQLMRRTKGQANPQLANDIFRRLLEE